ncbi:MAG: hypothetical protein JSV66_10550 [Trueperaceae bacterium]|nr:MAG: hypothetical protein JSV66_10550 [Trueperaceae bacterium]
MFTSPDGIYRIHQHRAVEFERQGHHEPPTRERGRPVVRVRIAKWLVAVARSLDPGLVRGTGSA